MLPQCCPHSTEGSLQTAPAHTSCRHHSPPILPALHPLHLPVLGQGKGLPLPASLSPCLGRGQGARPGSNSSVAGMAYRHASLPVWGHKEALFVFGGPKVVRRRRGAGMLSAKKEMSEMRSASSRRRGSAYVTCQHAEHYSLLKERRKEVCLRPVTKRVHPKSCF